MPDYEAPAERTGEPGTAVLALLVGLIDDARRAGSLADPGRLGLLSSDVDPAVTPLLADPMFAASDLDAMAVAQGLCAWTLLHGAVTSEIFGQLGPLPDAEALFVVLLAAGRSALLTDPAIHEAHPHDAGPRFLHMRPQVRPQLCAQRDLLETCATQAGHATLSTGCG